MDNIKELFTNGIFINDISRKNRQEILAFLHGADVGILGKIQVCSIVDYYCENSKAGHRIYEKLVTVINNKDKDTPPAKFNYEFIGKGNKARFTLFGDPGYIIKTLQLL